MALGIVNKKQTGSTAATTLTITSATAGSTLVAIVAQNSSTASITGSDNISGSTGWTTNSTHSTNLANTGAQYVMYKVAVGGETTLSPTAGSGGTIESITYWEVSGVGTSINIDSITATNGTGAQTSQTSAALTTTNAGSMVFIGCNFATATGTITAWTDSNAGTAGVPINTATATSCAIGGWYNPSNPLTSATFTCHWTTSAGNFGVIAIAIKPAQSPWTLIQSTQATGTGSVTATLASTPTQGHLLIASAAQPAIASSVVPSVADGNSNALTVITSGLRSANGQGDSLSAYIAGSSQSKSFTATGSGAGNIYLTVYEWSGNYAATNGTASTFLDNNQKASNGASSTGTSSVGPTTIYSDSMVWSAIGLSTAPTTTFTSAGASLIQTVGAIPAVLLADAIDLPSSPGTYNTSFAWNGTIGYVHSYAAFRAVTGNRGNMFLVM